MTIWTAGGSVLAAAVLAAALAHGTAAVRSSPGDQLQAPDTAPGVVSGNGFRHGGSGGS